MRELRPGTLFAGHRIEALVGRGGMGVVYRAMQVTLERTVALKVIAPDLLQDERARRRFLQECRLAASIDHPHVIPIYDAGEEDGVPYLAMRYVSGDDGRTLVRREGPLPTARAAAIVSQVAGALDAAHAAGLVHRDVKPANVLLAGDDHAYLADFGLTRRVRSMSSGTQQGFVGGDARLRRARADPRRARSMRGPTSTPWAACCSSSSPPTSRSPARTTRRSCGRT